MNELFTKDVINQLNVVMRENENSEEIGVNFTVYKGVASVSTYEADIINNDWLGGTSEYDYTINYRDWTEEEISTIADFNDLISYGFAKGDINYYDSFSSCWKFEGNIYEKCTDEKGGITKVKEEIPTEEKVYRIFSVKDGIILAMNKAQYDFFTNLCNTTSLINSYDYIDISNKKEILF